nr:peptidoglycan DD-metalloendopeptidase family protein [Poseidonocella sedimentorum]
MASPFAGRSGARWAVPVLALLAGCSEPVDLDIRDTFGTTLDTSAAVQTAVGTRPEPDARGVISYPNYQVAVARGGDTLATLAARVGVDAQELAQHNGIQTGDTLRDGEVIVLKGRVPEASEDVTVIAGRAIDEAEVQTTPLPAAPAAEAPEPLRHKVVRGETAFTVSRLYGVSVRALAEWNGLDANYTIKEGQYLLIPVAGQTPPERTAAAGAVTGPGAGSPTPTPPSASTPLPADDTTPVAAAPATPAPTPAPVASDGRLGYPVNGSIIREYAKGRNDGIDIAAPAGTAVKAAEAGSVAAITRNTENVPIVVLRHDDGLLTVYANVGDLSVEKGDTVRRGEQIATVRSGEPSFVHFEVRQGFESVDPVPYLN